MYFSAKRYHYLSLLFLFISSNSVFADEAWVQKALKLQRDIDLDTPINEATIIGTHNSYNSESYQIPYVRYTDPNQTLSVYNQLEAGVRSVEFDVHWTYNNHAQKDILLCHSGDDHSSCRTHDRPVGEGLKEIADWLKSHPDELILLYFERHVDGHEPQLAAEVEKYLGNYIFKPSQIRQSNNPTSCVTLPGTFKKADVFAAGKQLIVVTKGCDGSNPNYKDQDKYPFIWNDYGFSGIGEMKKHPKTFIDANVKDFLPYPDCGQSTVYKDDKNHTSMWRFYEDRRPSTNPNDKHIEPADMQEFMHCNINWPALDKLSFNDERLAASIWSWAPNYPIEHQGNCAYLSSEGIKNTDCETLLPGIICSANQGKLNLLASKTAKWSDGEKICQQEMGTNYHFWMPSNGKQLSEIKDLLQHANMTAVWLNYSMDSQGRWEPNKV